MDNVVVSIDVRVEHYQRWERVCETGAPHTQLVRPRSADFAMRRLQTAKKEKEEEKN